MFHKLKTNELNRLTSEEFKITEKTPVILVLDNIRSSYNVGAIFRTSDAFLIEKIFLCGITPTPPHKEIYKTAIGAENSVHWEYGEKISEVLNSLQIQGFEVIGLEQTKESIALHNHVWKEGTKFAIVLGNEVDGISNEALSYCKTCIEIPQFGTKHSFNVAVSCGIILWDFVKKIKL
jgi:23S rRNA (guanosine2251-2'-O)-methyltransferase